MGEFLLLGFPWIGLGMTIGIACLMAVYIDPFENLNEEIESGINEIDF